MKYKIVKNKFYLSQWLPLFYHLFNKWQPIYLLAYVFITITLEFSPAENNKINIVRFVTSSVRVVVTGFSKHCHREGLPTILRTAKTRDQGFSQSQIFTRSKYQINFTNIRSHLDHQCS